MRSPIRILASVLFLFAFIAGVLLFPLSSCTIDHGSLNNDMGTTYFSPDYFTARSRFREGSQRAGGRLTSMELDARGPAGEVLTIDIAWFGADKPKRVLVHSSGLHGVEAFAGSAVQLQLLDQGLPVIPEDSALVLVHVINPYGMAWLRRFNENSVDLNRNFLGPDEDYSGAPKGYPEFDSFLNPTSPPSWDFFYPRAVWLIARHGMSKLKQVIAGGQYEYPKGLFFGGSKLEEGPRRVQAFVRERLESAEHLVVIDVHTGLGPFAYDTLFVHAGDKGSSIYLNMKRAFGERVASLDPEHGPGYRIKGAYDTMYLRVLGEDKVSFLTQEFGTDSAVDVLYALREENRWHHYGGGTVDHPTKRDLKESFGPNDDSWRTTVLQRGKTVFEQAIQLAFRGR